MAQSSHRYRPTRFEVTGSSVVFATESRQLTHRKRSQSHTCGAAVQQTGLRQNRLLRPSAPHVEPGERKPPVEGTDPDQPPNAPTVPVEHPIPRPKEPVQTFAHVEPGE